MHKRFLPTELGSLSTMRHGQRSLPHLTLRQKRTLRSASSLLTQTASAQSDATSIEPHAAGRDRRHFVCGVHELNYWFRRHARPATAQDDARTYVALDEDGTVVGFHALAYGSVERTTAPKWAQTGARYPVPVLILARLAVSSSTQDSGIGKLLLRDAIDRCV